MGENQLLVDTDILIAYINRRVYRAYLENAEKRVYYSAVTKKELLSKQGLTSFLAFFCLRVLIGWGGWNNLAKALVGVHATSQYDPFL
ncbi:MAG: hypothetical protein ACREQA_08840 [Candidatus Binatia bacterium]